MESHSEETKEDLKLSIDNPEVESDEESLDSLDVQEDKDNSPGNSSDSPEFHPGDSSEHEEKESPEFHPGSEEEENPLEEEEEEDIDFHIEPDQTIEHKEFYEYGFHEGELFIIILKKFIRWNRKFFKNQTKI